MTDHVLLHIVIKQVIQVILHYSFKDNISEVSEGAPRLVVYYYIIFLCLAHIHYKSTI